MRLVHCWRVAPGFYLCGSLPDIALPVECVFDDRGVRFSVIGDLGRRVCCDLGSFVSVRCFRCVDGAFVVLPTILTGVYALVECRGSCGLVRGYVVTVDAVRNLAKVRAEHYTPSELILLKKAFGLSDINSLFNDRGREFINIYGERGSGKTLTVLSSLVSSGEEWLYVRFTDGRLVGELLPGRSVVCFDWGCVGLVGSVKRVVLDDVHYLWWSGKVSLLSSLLKSLSNVEKAIIITDEPLEWFRKQGLKIEFDWVSLPWVGRGVEFWIRPVDSGMWVHGYVEPILRLERGMFGFYPSSPRVAVSVFMRLRDVGGKYYWNVLALGKELGVLNARLARVYEKYLDFYNALHESWSREVLMRFRNFLYVSGGRVRREVFSRVLACVGLDGVPS